MRYFEFPAVFKVKKEKKFGSESSRTIFLRNREIARNPTFGERFGIRLLWLESARSLPSRCGFVSNRRRRNDLNGSAGLKRPFKSSDLRNCELNFNFRGKSWGIENHTCFISHGFYVISRISILTAGKLLVAIITSPTLRLGFIYDAPWGNEISEWKRYFVYQSTSCSLKNFISTVSWRVGFYDRPRLGGQTNTGSLFPAEYLNSGWQKLGVLFHSEKRRDRGPFIPTYRRQQRGSGLDRQWSSPIWIKYATFVSRQMIQTHTGGSSPCYPYHHGTKAFSFKLWSVDLTWEESEIFGLFSSLFCFWKRMEVARNVGKRMPTFQTHWHAATLGIIRRKTHEEIKKPKKQWVEKRCSVSFQSSFQLFVPNKRR